jgi:hypothetical protein
MMRLMCLARAPGVLCVIGLIGLGAMGISSASAQANNAASQEARDACTNDAMQFCSEFVPDVDKITKCMVAKRRLLSRRCQIAMANEHKRFQRKR